MNCDHRNSAQAQNLLPRALPWAKLNRTFGAGGFGKPLVNSIVHSAIAQTKLRLAFSAESAIQVSLGQRPRKSLS
jgi:hypothetical protein